MLVTLTMFSVMEMYKSRMLAKVDSPEIAHQKKDNSCFKMPKIPQIRTM